MNPDTTSERPLRSDAERNRTRILAAAAELFAARGVDASLEEAAARAGVRCGERSIAASATGSA